LALLPNQSNKADEEASHTRADEPVSPASLMRGDRENTNQHERHTEYDEVAKVSSPERTVCLVNWHDACKAG